MSENAKDETQETTNGESAPQEPPPDPFMSAVNAGIQILTDLMNTPDAKAKMQEKLTKMAATPFIKALLRGVVGGALTGGLTSLALHANETHVGHAMTLIKTMVASLDSEREAALKLGTTQGAEDAHIIEHEMISLERAFDSLVLAFPAHARAYVPVKHVPVAAPTPAPAPAPDAPPPAN
jgi:hypothetical protein